MFASSQTTKRVGYGGGDAIKGKCICVSIPAHELHLIEEMDRLAHLECVTRSKFLLRCVRREAAKVKDQIGTRYQLT